jgi:hypothetical protein
MAAHCETGTIMSMLNHAGLPISEPMVFGISGGIFFAYLESSRMPFPMIVTRTKPGDIRKKISKRIGAEFVKCTFQDPARAQQQLDSLLLRQIPVSTQVDMFNMDYIPMYMKAHFNGHFIIIVGKENDSYLVSDCYYRELTSLNALSLEKARFAKGDLAPKGLMYYIKTVNKNPDLYKIIIKGIQDGCKNMLKIPIPFLGVKGIRRFAKKVVDWPKIARDEEHLSHEIMSINITLEDRGTGGAGFRFMYATFLQEASKILARPDFSDMAGQMMGIGDRWREISLFSARIGKKHDLGPDRLKDLQGMILKRADEEEKFFKQLYAIVK